MRRRYDEKAVAKVAKEAFRDAVKRKLTLIGMTAIVTLVILLYLVSLMYTRFGSFTVAVNKYDQIQYGLALSEHRDFSNMTPNLVCRASNEITCIDGRDLANYSIGATDGAEVGKNYLAYTFYCKNTGKKTVNFDQSIVVTNMSLGIEEAVRIRVMSKLNDGELVTTDYAKAAGVENGEAIPEEGTIPFYGQNTVMKDSVVNFQPGEVIKFTIVIWLEGNDPQCIDNIIGGEFKIDMKFSVTGTAMSDEDAE